MEVSNEFSNYRFYKITECNMCGSPESNHRLMGQRLNQSTGLRPKTKAGISVSVFECKNCGLIFSNPMPVPNNIQDHYGLPPETYWKEENFSWDENYFAYEIKQLNSIMEVKSGMKSLDVGAGLGRSMISLEKAGFDSYGIEASIPFYERAISKMGVEKNKLKLGMLEDVEYDENVFDFITFGAVLEHLYNPAQSLQKAFKWLKPGGIIHVEVPSSKHLVGRLINRYYKLRGTNYVTNISPMHSPFHLYEFDVKSFEELAKHNNFSIAKVEHHVCEIMFFPNFSKPFLRKYMELTKKGMMLIIWLQKK